MTRRRLFFWIALALALIAFLLSFSWCNHYVRREPPLAAPAGPPVEAAPPATKGETAGPEPSSPAPDIPEGDPKATKGFDERIPLPESPKSTPPPNGQP